MAVQLLAGLARVGGSLGRAGSGLARAGGRVAANRAKSFAKDKAKDKVKEKLTAKKKADEDKNKIKGKKASKKSSEITSSGDSEVNALQQQSSEQDQSSSKSTSKSISATTKPSGSQVAQLKMNVTNIHNFLVNYNKNRSKIQNQNKRFLASQVSRDKLELRERKLKTSPFGDSIKNIKNSTQSEGNVLDKLLEFIGIVVFGIIVNALPAIIEKVQEIIDNIVNFLTPIISGFNLIKGFFTGELDQKEYDVDKKRVDDALKNFDADGGIIDQMAAKLGPLGVLVKQLKPLVGNLRKGIRKKNTVLAKKDGKEGFLNKETGEFTERQWTSAERKKARDSSGGGGDGGGDGGEKELVMEEGNYSGNVNITSRFGMRTLNGRRDRHMGVDIAGPLGTPLLAFTDGKVTATGIEPKGYGNYVAWVDKFKIEHFYAHMRSSALVKAGQQVKKGTKLGEMGNTGKSSGSHLHWETSTNPGDTGMPKSAILSRFDPLSKYPYSAPFGGAVEKGSGNSGEGGGSRITKLPDLPPENESHTVIIQPYRTIQTQIVYT